MLRPYRSALRGAALYAGIATVWILVSDWLVFTAFDSYPAAANVAAIKGLAFVLITAGLLYLVLRRKLEDSERLRAYLAAIIEASPLAVLDVDAKGRVKSIWNPAAERMFGYSADEAIGRTLPFVPPEKMEEFAEIRRQVMAGGSLDGTELVRRRKDGSDITILLATAPVPNPRGAIDTVMSVIADITDRKRAENDLRQLLGEVHHRVKNNLQLILSLLRIQSSLSPVAESSQEALEQLLRRVGTIALVHDQLTVPEDIRGVDLRRCLYDLVSKFRSHFSEGHRPAAITIEAEPTTVGLDTAIPSILLAGELLHLALGICRDGADRSEVELRLPREGASPCLAVAVSGAGVPAAEDGAPMILAESLAAQLGCTIHTETAADTVRFVVSRKA